MNVLSNRFINIRRSLDDKNFLIATITYLIAPTSANLKPSSLITFTAGGRNLLAAWNKYKYLFTQDSLIPFFELKNSPTASLVLFYNPIMLQEQLYDQQNMHFLQAFGYHKDMAIDEMLNLLDERFADSCPHEIGIFLGFPSYDVRGFIENKGQDYLLCGYWKVYSNVEYAKNAFSVYNQAKEKALHEIDRLLL